MSDPDDTTEPETAGLPLDDQEVKDWGWDHSALGELERYYDTDGAYGDRR